MDRLSIDCERTVDALVRFIRDSAAQRGKEGALVAVSGGLDSAVAAALCAKALGADGVVGLNLPEKEGPPDAAADARRVAEWLGIELRVRDITGALDALGAYDFVLSRIPTRTLRRQAVRLGYRYFTGPGGLDPLTGAGAGGHRLVSRAAAQIRAKHRMRMVAACFEADGENRLVVGAANRTEKLTGLFCRFGVDDNADVMPLARLFRTQELRLAERLGVPRRIRQKPPDPGIIPGADDKYVFFTGMKSDRLDAVLAALEAGRGPAAIARELDVGIDRVEHVQQLMRASARMRRPAAAPEPVTGRNPSSAEQQ